MDPAAAGTGTQEGAEDRLLLVDVREEWEWEAGRLPGSVHLPLGTLPARTDEIPANLTPVFICAAGASSMRACQFLATQGRDAINLKGRCLCGAECLRRRRSAEHDHNH